MGALIAPDDLVRRRADVNGGRAPLLILDPLIEFLDAHGLGRANRRSCRSATGTRTPPTPSPAAISASSCAARRAAAVPASPPTTCCARRGCCARWQATGARVPKVLAVGEDESVIGAPFYVSEMVEGTVSRSRRRRRSTRPSSMCGSPTSSSTRWSRSTPSIGAPPGWRTSASRRATPSARCGVSRACSRSTAARDPGAGSHDAVAAAQHPGVAGDDDRPRRLPARQRDVRARRARRAWSPSSTGRWPRSATRSPTSAT